jgi:lipopolysaccharide export system permease protein
VQTRGSQNSATVLWDRATSASPMPIRQRGQLQALMTSIFDRYMFRQAAGALVLILLSLSGVVWIALALRELNVVTSSGQSTTTFLMMTTLALPNLMALIAPVALLVALIHTLTRLNGDSELIVLTASGATMWTVARPLLFLALLVSLAVSSINHVVMPWSLRELRQIVTQLRSDLIGQVIQPGVFSAPEVGLTFHIRDRALNGELQGVMMQDNRDPKQAMTYLAERGVLQKQGQASYLFMTNGHIIRRENVKEPPQIIAFETYAIDLDRFDKPGAEPELKPRERYYSELAHPLPNDPDYVRQPGFFRAELHERFSSPIYPFAFVAIALAFVGQAQSTRQNRWKGVAAAVLAGFALRVSGLGINNLVVINQKWVPAMYAWPLGAIVIAMVLIWWKARPKSGPRIADRIGIALGDLWARLRPLRPAASQAPRRTDRARATP